jgi:hypothetical protein
VDTRGFLHTKTVDGSARPVRRVAPGLGQGFPGAPAMTREDTGRVVETAASEIRSGRLRLRPIPTSYCGVGWGKMIAGLAAVALLSTNRARLFPRGSGAMSPF